MVFMQKIKRNKTRFKENKKFRHFFHKVIISISIHKIIICFKNHEIREIHIYVGPIHVQIFICPGYCVNLA